MTDRRLSSASSNSRRSVLKAISVGGAGLLAGCAGGDGGDGDDSGGGSDGGDGGGSTGDGGGSTGDGSGGNGPYTLVSGPEGVLVYGVGSAMSATARQHSDVVINVQGGPSGQGLAELLRGNNQLAAASAYLVLKALRGEGDPWASVEVQQEPMQIMTMMDQRTGAVTKTSSDFHYLEDVAGATVGYGPAGASFNDPWQEVIDIAVGDGDVEYQPIAVGQESSSLASGRVDVQVVPMFVNHLNPSHISQVYVENDARVMSFQSETVEQIRAETDVGVAATPNSDLPDNVAEFTGESESMLTQARYSLLGTSEVPADTVYTFMQTLWENREQFGEAHAGARAFSDIEFWTTSVVPEIPVHPGAAEFFQEMDVWDDQYEVGDA